jgi:asparagine synthase (glutamine-hydrolysing)
LDSSSVFCVAETLARENPGLPRVIGSARTFPTGSPADEAAFLLDIERQYGILLDRLPITPTEFVDDSRQWAWRTETPVLVSDATGLHTLSHFVDHLGARVVLTGHWGDQFLCDQMYLMDMLRRGSFLQVRGHLKQYREYFTPEGFKFLKRCFLNNVARFCTPHALAPLLRRFRARWFPNPQAPRYYASAFAERAKDVARQPTFIQNTLERPHATYHAASLYTTVRSRHHIMWMEWADKAGAYVRLQFLYPFLDRDLIAFQMAIPGDIQTRGGVPKAILRQAMKGIVPEAVLERRWKADFGMATNAGIEQEYNKLFDCLSPSSMVAKMGYAEQEQLTRQLESARSRIAGSTGELAGVLMDLLGLELFLEAFCGEPRSCHFAHSK